MWGLLLSSLAVSAIAAPLNIVHEKRVNSFGAHLFSKRIVEEKDAIVPVRIGLTQRNLDRGYDHVMDVSDPSSKNYGKHWTSKDVEAEFAPSSQSFQLVQDWLREAGIDHAEQTASKGWIAFDIPVGRLEHLLNAQFHEFEDVRDGSIRLGCDEYSLPQHLAPHVDYITPGVKLSAAMHKVKRSSASPPRKLFSPPSKPVYGGPVEMPAGAGSLPPDLRTCGSNITPPCVRALYDIPNPGTIKVCAGELGIFESEDQYNQTDLNLFFAKFAPYVPQGTHPLNDTINGPQLDNYDGGESDIDFDQSYGLLGPVEITLYQTAFPENYNGSDTLFDPFLDAVDASYCSAADRKAGLQCGVDTLTTVVSFSYGTPELFYSSAAAEKRTCNEFMKYTLQGHTFVFSSGDYGVASNPGFGFSEFLCTNNGCIAQDLNNSQPNSFNGTIFSPQFPSNCPYVLAVGATQLLADQTVNDPESAMNVPGIGCGPGVVFSSGGGFSNYFPRPSYQNASVSAYFAKNDPGYKSYNANGDDVQSAGTNIGKNGGIYNRAGRGYPDVSANGANMTIFNFGRELNFYGTSLAAPIWASVISLLNSERAAMGKSNVGFVNPVLYQHPEVFHDIVSGSNPGCDTKGFAAVPGWDPLTGLGTPNFPALSSLFKSLP